MDLGQYYELFWIIIVVLMSLFSNFDFFFKTEFILMYYFIFPEIFWICHRKKAMI